MAIFRVYEVSVRARNGKTRKQYVVNVNAPDNRGEEIATYFDDNFVQHQAIFKEEDDARAFARGEFGNLNQKEIYSCDRDL